MAYQLNQRPYKRQPHKDQSDRRKARSRLWIALSVGGLIAALYFMIPLGASRLTAAVYPQVGSTVVPPAAPSATPAATRPAPRPTTRPTTAGSPPGVIITAPDTPTPTVTATPGGLPTAAAPAVATVSLVTNTPTPSAPTSTATPTLAPTLTPTATPTATPSPTATVPTAPTAPTVSPSAPPLAPTAARPSPTVSPTITTAAPPSILTPVATSTLAQQPAPSILTPIAPPPGATVSLVTNTPTPIVVAPTATATPTVSPTPTATPTATPSPTATDLPTLVITATYLYSGPGIQFTLIATVQRGTVIVVVGQTLDGDWYLLDNGSWIEAALVGNAPVDPTVVTPQAQPFIAASVQGGSGAYALRDANLRGGPGTEYPIEGGVKAGTPLTIVGASPAGDWYQLEGGCWIAAFLVGNATPGLATGSQSASVVSGLPSTAIVPAPQFIAVVFRATNIYTGPGLQYPVTTRVEQGQLVTLVAQSFDGNWYLLDSGNWIASFMVDIVPPGGILTVPIAPPVLPAPRTVEIPIVVQPSPSSLTPIPTPVIYTPTPVEQEYISRLHIVWDGYAFALAQIETQMNLATQSPALILDSEWLKKSSQAIELLQTQNQAARQLQAPPRYTNVQAELLVAANHYDLAATLFKEAVEQLDVNKVTQAVGELNAGNDALNRSKALLPTVGASASPPSILTPVPVATQGGLQPSPQTCDPSYPTVCIPPPPPILSCAEIGFRNFTVSGSDPHGFDGDRNGIGCEE